MFHDMGFVVCKSLKINATQDYLKCKKNKYCLIGKYMRNMGV